MNKKTADKIFQELARVQIKLLEINPLLEKNLDEKNIKKIVECAVRAHELKVEKVVTLIPGIKVKNNIEIYFFLLYDLFVDLEKTLIQIPLVTNPFVNHRPDANTKRQVARLKISLQEIDQLLQYPWPRNSKARQKLKELRVTLKNEIRIFNGFLVGKKVVNYNPSILFRVQKFLECSNTKFDLFKVYEEVKFLDQLILDITLPTSTLNPGEIDIPSYIKNQIERAQESMRLIIKRIKKATK